jgi:hypothetical protein
MRLVIAVFAALALAACNRSDGNGSHRGQPLPYVGGDGGGGGGGSM